MANIEITAVEFADSWAPGATQSVDVRIDNHESLGPAGWGPVVCGSDGLVNSGHMTDVTLRIESAGGTTVYEETKGECVPVERPSTAGGPNATVHFEPAVSVGDYNVSAELQVRGNNGFDSSDLYPLTVSESGSETPPEGDTGGGGLWSGSPDIDPSDPVGSISDNPMLAAAAALAVLVLLSSYADLAASAMD